jgi:hypothetical protein
MAGATNLSRVETTYGGEWKPVAWTNYNPGPDVAALGVRNPFVTNAAAKLALGKENAKAAPSAYRFVGTVEKAHTQFAVVMITAPDGTSRTDIMSVGQKLPDDSEIKAISDGEIVVITAGVTKTQRLLLSPDPK